ncbi:DUF3685 domain-containing protein [Cronbergia sp. UHCC 0137]|uniref:DUF3685 domain-containing protein n=1 Tax=Cronbergia sp. UHCC 0137 TaxID=3110239 RepID=UPI002B1FA6C3|nr:DUF3685 domain-containing protein [Cronbergia sp. UHCC 0137]MEA5619161.1 DUF3685 domain-containing protein [Cronbergia sp. UHCC 0137]
MSDRPLKLLLIDPDPIFRLGLCVALETISNIQIVADVATDTAALKFLVELAAQDPNQVNLLVLELGNGRSIESQQLSLQFCRQIKALYPHLPIFLLSSAEQDILLTAKALGVNGYAPKGLPISELVPAMQKVANNGYYWFWEKITTDLSTPQTISLFPHLSFFKLRNNLRLSGISYIDTSLKLVTTQLQIPGIPLLDKAVLAGQQRELLAARWFLNNLLTIPQERQQEKPAQQINPPIPPISSVITKSEPQQIPNVPPLMSPRSLQSALFSSCVYKFQFSLENITELPLEIDILREEKKRELLYLILQKLAQQLEELRFVQVKLDQLHELKDKILLDLWQAVITEFFGKFTQITVDNKNIEIVNYLLENPEAVKTEILNKIPLVIELFSYLILQTDLYIDNNSYPAGSEQAKFQASRILENLLIQIGNAVLQPLLNSLADVEIIKQNFYHRQLISTREIEKFRNNLSWKYRLNNYITEAQAIFESRYDLFVFTPRGIAKIAIYAPRSQELAQLSGIPLTVTLLLEFRDAIAPGLQSLLSFVGSGIIFVLTQIVGRGLGLIGRGILQGIGSVTLPEKKPPGNHDKTKR